MFLGRDRNYLDYNLFNTDEMTDESIMPIGKYKGQKMANISAEYLLWLLENGNTYGELRKYLTENKDVFESEINYKNKSK
jgi:uncharacterized protein (DUF3820 family)